MQGNIVAPIGMQAITSSTVRLDCEENSACCFAPASAPDSETAFCHLLQGKRPPPCLNKRSRRGKQQARFLLTPSMVCFYLRMLEALCHLVLLCATYLKGHVVLQMLARLDDPQQGYTARLAGTRVTLLYIIKPCQHLEDYMAFQVGLARHASTRIFNALLCMLGLDDQVPAIAITLQGNLVCSSIH